MIILFNDIKGGTVYDLFKTQRNKITKSLTWFYTRKSRENPEDVNQVGKKSGERESFRVNLSPNHVILSTEKC